MVSRRFAKVLAGRIPFARRLVNSGRLLTASVVRDSPLSTLERDCVPISRWCPARRGVDAPVHFAAQVACSCRRRPAFAGVLFCGEQGVHHAIQAALATLARGSFL